MFGLIDRNIMLDSLDRLRKNGIRGILEKCKRGVTVNLTFYSVVTKQYCCIIAYSICMHKRLVFLLLTIFLLIQPSSNVLANVAPPPTRIWLRFYNSDNSIPRLDSVQLVGCSNINCNSPILLKKYGKCTLSGCLSTAPILSKAWSFDCASSRCLFVYDRLNDNTLPTYLQLIVQSSGRISTSAIIETPQYRYFNGFQWKVIIEVANLTIVDDTRWYIPNFAEATFFNAYGFNIIVELLIAGIFVWLWRKKKEIPKFKMLGSVILANLLSYPVSWLLIPSFGQFQYLYVRTWGIISSIGAGFYTVIAILLTLRKSDAKQTDQPVSKLESGSFWEDYHRSKLLTLPQSINSTPLYHVASRNRFLILSFLSVPFCLLFMLYGAFFTIYGQTKVYVQGLPSIWIIPLAEAYAVVFETIFIFILSKKTLSFLQTASMCLTMNAVSFLLGLVLL